MPMPEYWLHLDEFGQSVRVTGAMLKKGGSRGGRRNWSKRWFVLEPTMGRLRYYEDASLLKEAGVVCLLAASEVWNDETPTFKGRHAPPYEGEDAFYMELRGSTDGRGRPRPHPFSLRAFRQSEYDEWLRSLRFCIRQLASHHKTERYLSLRPDPDDLKLVSFKTAELGFSLALSREVVSGQGRIVISSTNPDRGDGIAARLLRLNDELIAVHPPHSSPHQADPLSGAQALPEDLAVSDFEHILASLRTAPRPLALVFHRQREAPAHDRACVVGPSDVADEDGADLTDFYILDDDNENCPHDPVNFETLHQRWLDGRATPDVKIYVADAWVSIRQLPALLKRLEETPAVQSPK